MAKRKTAPRRTARKPSRNTRRVPFSMAFWVLFFIVLISLFFILMSKAKKGITLPSRQVVTEQPAFQEPGAEEPVAQKPPAQEQKPAQEPRVQPKPATEKPPTAQERRQERATPEKPATQQPKPLEQRQPPETPAKPPAQPAAPPERKPPETRDRTVYFMRDSGVELTLTKTTRKLAVSDSPLIDCVNALLIGPTAEEKNRGLSSFIPPNTRLLSARVAGNTVHLNFNEEFRYNTFGREGCEAQLRQIVWTATEFPNVNNVQIEINGKIVDFLIEGVTIRNPIGR